MFVYLIYRHYYSDDKQYSDIVGEGLSRCSLPTTVLASPTQRFIRSVNALTVPTRPNTICKCLVPATTVYTGDMDKSCERAAPCTGTCSIAAPVCTMIF